MAAFLVQVHFSVASPSLKIIFFKVESINQICFIGELHRTSGHEYSSRKYILLYSSVRETIIEYVYNRMPYDYFQAW